MAYMFGENYKAFGEPMPDKDRQDFLHKTIVDLFKETNKMWPDSRRGPTFWEIYDRCNDPGYQRSAWTAPEGRRIGFTGAAVLVTIDELAKQGRIEPLVAYSGSDRRTLYYPRADPMAVAGDVLSYLLKNPESSWNAIQMAIDHRGAQISDAMHWLDGLFGTKIVEYKRTGPDYLPTEVKDLYFVDTAALDALAEKDEVTARRVAALKSGDLKPFMGE